MKEIDEQEREKVRQDNKKSHFEGGCFFFLRVWKNQEKKWEWDKKNTKKKKKRVTSKQPGRKPVCVCIPLSIKVSAASYFSSAAGDVRTSSALFPALAPGEFITSASACDCLEAAQFKEQPTNVFCCFPLCCLSELDLFFSFLFLLLT